MDFLTELFESIVAFFQELIEMILDLFGGLFPQS